MGSLEKTGRTIVVSGTSQRTKRTGKRPKREIKVLVAERRNPWLLEDIVT